MKNNKILFFANIPIENEERSIGGATVLAKNILDFILLDPKLEVCHIQIRTFWRNRLQLIDYLIWIFKFPFVARTFKVVSFHGTKDFHFTIAPILWMWSKLFKKRTVYHFFGGNFQEQYEALPSFFKWVINKTILQSDTVFFETLELMSFFETKGVKNAKWLPNARKPIETEITKIQFENKFVFISRVIPQKGINEIVEAAKLLPKNFCIDVYGPIDDRHYKNTIFKNSNVNYKGVLQPDEITPTLLKYNVLLLPSYFEGEGYPGIIIESLALGVPVITTNWKALPEVITDGYNGFLIPIRDSQKLSEAIKQFNINNYSKFSSNALSSFDKFNSNVVFKRIIESYLE